MPRRDFDPIFYIQNYPDVKASGMDPFVHYLKYGKFERRATLRVYDHNEKPNASFADDYALIYDDFDREYYLNSYKDVAEQASIRSAIISATAGWKGEILVTISIRHSTCRAIPMSPHQEPTRSFIT